MRSSIVRRGAAFSLVAGAAGVGWYLASGWRGWVSPAHLLITAALAVAVAVGAVALWRGSPHRRTIGGAILLIGCALVLLGVPRVLVVSTPAHATAYLGVLAALTFVSGAGVLLRSRAARWLALGSAVAGTVSSGLNLAQWMLAGVVDTAGWALAIWTLGSALVVAVLSGPDLAAGDRVRAAREAVWSRRDPLVGWMRAAIVTGVAACLMLVVYATMQADAVASLRGPALALAVLLAVAAFLAARGQVLGGMLLAVGAAGLATLSASIVAHAPSTTAGLRIAGYYLVFWLPACISGLACGAALIRRRLE
jgi:hypothetical protein